MFDGSRRYRVRPAPLSRPLAPAEPAAVVREAWTIENHLRWPLDVVPGEGHAPHNSAPQGDRMNGW